MPSIIYDFKPLQEAARLLEGADVHQPMAVKTEEAAKLGDATLTDTLDELYFSAQVYPGFSASDFDGA